MTRLEMFCNQCEQTRKGGCTTKGVCGKDAEVAALQDALTYAVRGLAHWAVTARAHGINDAEINRFTAKALFSTLTNVNFDPTRFEGLIARAAYFRAGLHARLADKGVARPDFADPATRFIPALERTALVQQGVDIGLPIDRGRDEDVQSLQEIVLYGLRGVAAYLDHAAILGYEDDSVYAFMQETLVKLTDKDLGVDEWVGLALETGKQNLRAMQLLDEANTSTYGHPVPTQVPLGHKVGKAIMISGHDLRDLEELLKQSEGKGINVYTHGEMLPTHAYPELKNKYPHFYGHFGTAWVNQQAEFPYFPGAILMTTNCLMPPRKEYSDHLFTTGVVGFSGVRHVERSDFSPVIKKALELNGYLDEDHEAGTVWTGFARNAILGDHPSGSVADVIVDHVKAGKIKHFFLVGGCDGAHPDRNYYNDFVDMAPKDSVILTLACGKFRFFDKDLGAIDGIPRLVDVGQCNDSYSAIQVAVALSEAFEMDVNDLPLSLILSWYEQKAVAILLTLLHLGIKNIRIGPSLPNFVSPNVLNVLVDTFQLTPITTAEEDLEAILGTAAV
jgi:hydroxylamine reductase